MSDAIQLLRLLHLADSALPVGAAAHSFGLEMLASNASVDMARLPLFLQSYVEETLAFEAWFVRAGHRSSAEKFDAVGWKTLNIRLSAFKAARESRAASLMMGRRLLQLLAHLEAVDAPSGDAHYSAAFGYAGGVLGSSAADVALAYVQQSAMGMVSCAQRLLPLGQQAAQRMLWQLKPALAVAVEKSTGDAPPPCCAPMLDISSMQHARLDARLFIS
ncbi:MAG: hypothetical protein NTZ50_04525 [Chloroflexi bacterium]|nr:hypothetical protein [Chloroflexota bacterium]